LLPVVAGAGVTKSRHPPALTLADLYKSYILYILTINHYWVVMRYISATEAKQNFAAALDAAQRGPVVIRRQARDQAVLISPQEYDRLRGLAVADFEVFCDRVGSKAVAQGLTERKLAALLKKDA
jgi:antitoxin Phd